MSIYFFKKKLKFVKKVEIEDSFINSFDNDIRKEILKNIKKINGIVFSYQVKGKQYNGFFIYPKRKRKLPLIIYNRGGIGYFGVLKKANFFCGTLANLANNGYAILGSQYIGLGKKGAKDEICGEDFNSVLYLKEFIYDNPTIDQDKIGLYGVSRGGITTFKLLAEKNWIKIKAAVVVSGMIDLLHDKKFRPDLYEYYNSILGRNREEKIKRSVMYWPEKISKNVPILMMYGSSDWRVDPVLALELSKKFINLKVPHRLIIFEGNDHYLTESRKEADAMIINWFDRFIKRNEKIPDLNRHGL